MTVDRNCQEVHSRVGCKDLCTCMLRIYRLPAIASGPVLECWSSGMLLVPVQAAACHPRRQPGVCIALPSARTTPPRWAEPLAQKGTCTSKLCQYSMWGNTVHASGQTATWHLSIASWHTLLDKIGFSCCQGL